MKELTREYLEDKVEELEQERDDWKDDANMYRQRARELHFALEEALSWLESGVVKLDVLDGFTELQEKCRKALRKESP